MRIWIICLWTAATIVPGTAWAGTPKPLGVSALKGTYVFSGRVLLNPTAGAPAQVAPARVLVDCFSIGELRFNGRGKVKRRVEIRCPTVLTAGLGAPPPVGEPTSSEIAQMGSGFVSEGEYTLGTDGWGTFSDRGSFRLGPVPGNPTTGAGRIIVSKVKDGIARELVFLLDHQSLQPPGAPISFNSDIGASFVATRR